MLLSETMNRSEVRVEIKSVAADFLRGLDWMSHGVEIQVDHPDEMSQDPQTWRVVAGILARSTRALDFIEAAATDMEQRGSKGAYEARDRLRSASGYLTGVTRVADRYPPAGWITEITSGLPISSFPGHIGPVEAVERIAPLIEALDGLITPAYESQMKARLDRIERARQEFRDSPVGQRIHRHPNQTETNTPQ